MKNVVAKPGFESRTGALGLLVRKERWRLSWRGWLIALTVAILAVGLFLKNLHSFLALNERIDARTLVVEGWVHPYAIEATLRELGTNSYEHVFTTGGPVIGTGGYTSDFNTAAGVGAEHLRAAGVASGLVQMVPCHRTDRDRTFSSAVALRDWLQQHDMKVDAINVITEHTHGRRTRLLFEKAFQQRVKIGVISVPSPDYDAKHWWRSSEGVEDVVDQAVAYFYAKFFFHGDHQST